MEFKTSHTKTVRAMNATAVGTTTLTTSAIDTAGAEAVRCIVMFGTITDGPPSIKARQGKQSNMSDGADLASTAVAEANTDDNKIAILDIIQPRERYVDFQIVRGGATGCVIDGVIVELYYTRTSPITQDATVAAFEKWQSPEEGTA